MIVTFEKTEIARRYAEETRLSWPLLVDENRELYRAYGMTKGHWWQLYGFPSWIAYFKLFFRGWGLRRPSGDVTQLGGDVLIDPQGTVRFYHVGEGPADRPAVEGLLEMLSTEKI